MSSLWYNGLVGGPDELNKLCNIGSAADVDDGTELPTTVGEAIFQFDKPRISLSQDGETYGLKIPVIVAVPATAASEGLPGQIAIASGWLYVCTSENTWQRTALTTW